MPNRDESQTLVRLATFEDVPALENLIADSVNRLQAEDYSEGQRLGALGSVFGVDPMLIADRTYFVVEWNSEIAACGGWSRRATPFGSGRSPARDDTMLDPARDAARIRALFVHPSFARRGLGSLILETCESAARSAGFRSAELTATLTGTRLFRARGYIPAGEIRIPLGNGELLPVLRMTKPLVQSIAGPK